MSFGLKNPLFKFQNIMTDMLNPYSDFNIVYIDDILIFSKNNRDPFQTFIFI